MIKFRDYDTVGILFGFDSSLTDTQSQNLIRMSF